MSKRSRRKGDLRSSFDVLSAEFDRGRRTQGRIFSVTTYLPRPVAIKARREIYPYPYPAQRQLKGRVIREPLRSSRHRLIKTTIRIRLPRQLPVVRGSYVSLADGRLNIHSKYQLERMFNAQELNRRRYSEYKRNKRKASHGQLDSRGSQRFGSVAHAYRQGASIDKIADAALGARAVSQNRR